MNRHPLALLTGWDMVLFVLWMVASTAVVAGTILGVARVVGEPVLDQEEHELWTLINEYRQENGVQPVGLNDDLIAAAEWMSEDMATGDYFSHTDSQGRSAKQRMAEHGYIQNTMTGENLACGESTAQAVFDLLQGSPEHDANMLSSYFWAVGIARAYDENSTQGWYWAIDFGGRGPAWFPENAAAPPSGMTPVPGGTPTPTPVATTTPPTPEPPAAILVPAELPSTGTKP